MTTLIEENQKATTEFKKQLTKIADNVADEIAAAGMYGEKLPGGYMVVNVGEPILVVNGIQLNEEVASLDDFLKFRKDLNKGWLDKVKTQIKDKTNSLLEGFSGATKSSE